MAFEEGTSELTCPHCKAEHLAHWDRVPVREPYVLKCRRCRGVLAEGKDVRSFYSVTLKAEG